MKGLLLLHEIKKKWQIKINLERTIISELCHVYMIKKTIVNSKTNDGK